MMSAIYDKSIVPVRAPETRRSDRADESVFGSIVIIDDRSLERECLREIISNSYSHASCHAFNSIDAWRRARISDDQVIVFNLNHRSIFDDDALAQVRSLVADAGQSPVITISQVDEPTAILASLDAGTAGHIPSSASMADVIEAVRVVSSGGMFLPRANIMSVLRSVVSEKPARQSDGLEELFTARQLEVARALQRGAANKTIAYELNLCESTVKVHIRNIMRKLGVTNRTQAAYRLTEHIHQHDGPRI